MLSPEPKRRENVPVAMSVVIIVLYSELKVTVIEALDGKSRTFRHETFAILTIEGLLLSERNKLLDKRVGVLPKGLQILFC
jgi:hypothetical protein